MKKHQLILSVFLVLNLISFISVSGGEKGGGTLTTAVLPENAGTVTVTEIEGDSNLLELVAEAAPGWTFKEWTTDSDNTIIFIPNDVYTFVYIYEDCRITANFIQSTPFELVTSVYPADAAGFVYPSGTVLRNRSQMVEIAAYSTDPNSIFYKWTCSEGAELLDSYSAQSRLRLTDENIETPVQLTAHFFVRGKPFGSATFQSYYKEKRAGRATRSVNNARFKATFSPDLTQLTMDENTGLEILFGGTTAWIDGAFSEDAKRKINSNGGSIRLLEREPSDRKSSREIESVNMKWDASGITFDYRVRPPAGFNILDLYWDIYQESNGKEIEINSDDMGFLTNVILLEGENWCYLWIPKDGFSYQGTGIAVPDKVLQDNLVSWKIEGSGEYYQYEWFMPKTDESGKKSAGKKNRISHGASILKNLPDSFRTGQTQKNMNAVSPRKAADPGVRTQFDLWGITVAQSVTPNLIQAPFFFGGKIFAVNRTSNASLDRNRAIFSCGKLDSTGKFEYEKSFPMSIGDSKTAIFSTAERIATCVFKGSVHLFYDVNVGNSQQYKIYHATSSAPEIGWTNQGFVYNTSAGGDATGTYFWNGAWKHVPLKAVVFNGKIYLIIGATDGRFHLLSSADGLTWEWAADLSDASTWGDKFRGEIGACVVSRNGKACLCIVVFGTEKYNNFCYVRFFDANNKLVGGYHRILDWVSEHQPMSVAAGCVKDSQQGQMIQIFGQNSGIFWNSYWPVRRCAMNVESGSCSEWMDTPAQTGERDFSMVPCDTVEVTVPVQVSGPSGTTTVPELRKYIVMFTQRVSALMDVISEVVVYESDLFKADAAPSVVNTADKSTADPGCWTLIGVIEGVPPFTRNGNTDTSWLSKVTYGRTQETGSKSNISYEAEICAKGGFDLGIGGKLSLPPSVISSILKAKSPRDIPPRRKKDKDATVKMSAGFEMGGSFKALMSLADSYKVTLVTKWSEAFYSKEKNADGSLGYLLYAKPTLTSRGYTIYSQDKTIPLGTLALLNISDVLIDPVTYKLESPPAGMTARKPTSNLSYWKDNREILPTYSSALADTFSEGISVLGSSTPEMKFTKTVDQTRSLSGKVSLKINAELSGALKLVAGGGIEGGADVATAVKLSSSQSESFGEYVSVNYASIPNPPAGSTSRVSKFSVDCNWVLPKDNVKVSDFGTKPYWVPTANSGQLQAPWLVTWKVLSVSEVKSDQPGKSSEGERP